MKKLILIAPVWQTIWQWPAVVNLICGGTGSGLYLLNLMVAGNSAAVASIDTITAIDLAAPLLVLMGFAAVAVEAGRPRAAKFLLHHLRTSWMSREVLAGSFFILFATLDIFFHHPIFKFPAAIFACGLLFSQAMMVNRCRAVIAWNHYLCLYHFLVSGIYLGFGFLLMLNALQNIVMKPAMLGIGFLICGASYAIWHRMLFALKGGESLDQSLESLRDAWPLTFTIGLAHLVPMVIVLILLLAGFFDFDFRPFRGICAVTGMAIIIGGSAQKYDIILGSNLLRELSANYCTKRTTT